MAVNKAGPYTLMINTVWNNFPHDIEFNVDTIGTPVAGVSPADLTLRSKNGSGVPLQNAVDDIWGVLRVFFNVATLASTFTLWKRKTTNTERDFISSGQLTAPNGSSLTPNTTAHQATFTWRVGRGGIVKVQLMESIFLGENQVPIAGSIDPLITALNGYMLSGLNVIAGRDRSFPVAPMNLSLGQNEKMKKRRFR